MYYMETKKDDGYSKYVASMTGAAVVGVKVDDGVYLFETEKDCDRAIGVVNKIYGSGIFVIVAKQECTDKGKAIVKTKTEPKPEKHKNIIPPVTRKDMELSIVQRMFDKTAAPNPVTAKTGVPEAIENQVQTKDIVSAIIKTRQGSAKAPVREKEAQGQTIDLSYAANIGSEQYTLDESVSTFEVAVAKPVPRRRG